MGQITFMRLHDRYTDSFETGEVLNNAYNVKETRILNDTGSIEFDYPYDEKARLISQNMLVAIDLMKSALLFSNASYSASNFSIVALFLTCN